MFETLSHNIGKSLGETDLLIEFSVRNTPEVQFLITEIHSE